MSSSDTFYVTTPIYYVNSSPHLGHGHRVEHEHHLAAHLAVERHGEVPREPALDLLVQLGELATHRERALAPGNRFVEVVPAQFGADAGMVGAALMARDGLRDRAVA